MTTLQKLHDYFYNGVFRVYAPGEEVVVQLDKRSPTLDRLLEKRGATSYCFLSLNPLPAPDFALTQETEAPYLQSLQERNFELIIAVSEHGWAYQLSGFESDTIGTAGILCLLLLDVPVDELHTFLTTEGLEWYVVGQKGAVATLRYPM